MTSWPIEEAVPVAWGDLDAFGHVNNTVFFRWFETARMALFREVGVLEDMERTGVGPILARTECNFRLPVAYPDTIRARTGIQSIGTTSYVMAYQVWSDTHDAVAGEGLGVIVQLDYGKNTKVPLSDARRAALERLLVAPA